MKDADPGAAGSLQIRCLFQVDQAWKYANKFFELPDQVKEKYREVSEYRKVSGHKEVSGYREVSECREFNGYRKVIGYRNVNKVFGQNQVHRGQRAFAPLILSTDSF